MQSHFLSRSLAYLLIAKDLLSFLFLPKKNRRFHYFFKDCGGKQNETIVSLMSLYTVSISRKRARTRTKEKAHISTNSAPFISTFKNTITSSSDKTWETTLPTPCDITNVTYTPNEPSYSIVAALQTNFHLAILNGHDGNILASFPVQLPAL